MSKLLFDTKDVISVLNVDDAKEYLDKEGYCSNTIYELQEAINNGSKCKLVNVVNRSGRPFTYEYHEDSGIIYDKAGLFLPADKVKQTEKKWRPFRSIAEFHSVTGKEIGNVIWWRHMDESSKSSESLIVSSGYNLHDEPTITLGNLTYTLRELCDYEYLSIDDEWYPFGVEE